MAIESESALIFAITKKYHLFFSTPYKVTTIGVQKNNWYNNKKLGFKPCFSHKREYAMSLSYKTHIVLPTFFSLNMNKWLKLKL